MPGKGRVRGRCVGAKEKKGEKGGIGLRSVVNGGWRNKRVRVSEGER